MKHRWHSMARRALTRVAKQLGIPTTERVIRSNKAGPAVGGEVTMSAPIFGVYVSINCPYNGYGEKDWIGGSYARRATVSDPYGTGMDKPNHSFVLSSDKALVELLWKIKKAPEKCLSGWTGDRCSLPLHHEGPHNN